MRRRFTLGALMLGLVAVAIPGLARADLKVAFIEVKGMVCAA